MKENVTEREALLTEAASIITRDRNATHGEPEDNFADIGAFWTIYKGVEFTTWDVAIMCALIKIARMRTTPATRDHWLDLAGYAGCGWECIVRSAKRHLKKAKLGG